MNDISFILEHQINAYAGVKQNVLYLLTSDPITKHFGTVGFAITVL
jgi:hypothetical protein